MAVKSSTSKATQTYRVSTGIPGLDSVLGGGRPGTGKTTLAQPLLRSGKNGRGR
jgi:KaiC/GvpD/RAD55 family RecA-like ATPase